MHPIVSPDMLDSKICSDTAVNNIVDKIDKELMEDHIISDYAHNGKIHIILDEEYPVIIRDLIAEKYKEAGWKLVTHRTSSENDEPPGLTGFTFYAPSYMEDLPDAK